MSTPRMIGNRTYVLRLSDGKFRKIVVPASWKATFGPIISNVKGGGGYIQTIALRFYEGNKQHQRAAFTDVVSFRDTTITSVEHGTDIWTDA